MKPCRRPAEVRLAPRYATRRRAEPGSFCRPRLLVTNFRDQVGGDHRRCSVALRGGKAQRFAEASQGRDGRDVE
jgi:hypothetical protein